MHHLSQLIHIYLIVITSRLRKKSRGDVGTEAWYVEYDNIE